MPREGNKNSLRRISYLAGFFFLLIIALIGRLIQKQIFQHEHYLLAAKNQQIFSREELAQRGKIQIHDDLESKGSLVDVAIDVKRYSVSIVPQNVKDKRQVARELATVAELSEDELFLKIDNDKLYLPPIARNQTAEAVEVIEEKDLDGVLILPEYGRFYPENNLVSQTLGFVNLDGVGKYGVEGYYDDELRGFSGKRTAERDTMGRVINLISEEPPKNGDTLILSIDRSVQYYTEKAIEKALTDYQAESGSVIIVEPKTGRIVAIANKPDFNPNDYRKILSDQISIFTNPVISGAWEPGSIMKPISMAAAIDQGKVTPETKGVYSNYTVVDGSEIHTAEDKAFGEETMTEILENSDNVAMVDVANKLGNDLLYDYLNRFGLLEKSGVDIFGESTGQVPTLKNWRAIHRATISFGQGISVTPIQMVMAYSALANSGKLVVPKIVDKIVDCDGKESEIETREVGQVISPETASKISLMLESVVVNGHGKRAAVAGFRVGGKTGTAQVPKADGSGYEENIHIGSFVGFAPIEDPKFVMLVRLNNPKGVEFAESSAAPLFGQIANYLLNYYYKLPVK